MPFKPRIVRFDEEHAPVPTPAGGNPAAPLGASLVATLDNDRRPVDTPPLDPSHDTIRGEAFDTIANWDPDDALLNDPMMQCLARQLSDDAEHLARRYPADGWVPPPIEQGSERPRPTAYALTWRRAIAVAAALGACLLITLGSPASRDRGDRGIHAGESADSANRESQCTPPVDRVTYEDGDAAIWGANPIDDSQFGDVQFGVLQFGDDDANGGILSRPACEALRDLLPADSHEYCDVSM